MPWRVFPWDPNAKLGEPFSPSYIHPNQGSGRFDVAGTLVVYLAETAVHAVAEKLQRFRGQKINAAISSNPARRWRSSSVSWGRSSSPICAIPPCS